MVRCALLTVVLLSVCASAQKCSLEGQWYDPVSSTRASQLVFKFTDLPDYGESVIAVSPNPQWATGKVVFLNATLGSVVVKLDNGGTQVGTLNLTTCAEINWSIPKAVWVRVPRVEKVHVVFMNHLDVGYNGVPNTGYINNVLNVYFQEYFPRAIRLAEEMERMDQSGGFIYTTHPWLIDLYLNCPPYLFLNGIQLQCPSDQEIEDFETAIHKGYIAWHAGPMNMQVELMNEAVFKAALQISSDLDAKYGRKSTVLSQRDVPGITTAAIPVLLENGIEAVTVGVNSGSAPPAVPNIFHWKYQGSGIVAMWHPGGYPDNPGNSLSNAGGLSYMDCIIVEQSAQVLAFAFRTDNSGPPTSIQEILTYYEILEAEFPGAQVSASTYDNFVHSIDASSLPVVSGEIGDTWIQGVASDPRKMAEYRVAASAFQACIEDKQCDMSDVRVKNASRFLLKLPEHTWGLPDVGDTVNWTNSAFQKAKQQPNYVKCVNSWAEQRLFLNLTLQASYGHPLYDYFSKALSELIPAIPSLDGYQPVDPSKNFSLFSGKVTVCFDPQSGGISCLSYNNTYDFASSSNNLLGVLLYYTYNESDFQFMNSVYDYYGNAGYDKPNSTLNAHPSSSMYSPVLTKLYQSQKSPESFILLLEYNELAHSYYGAPEQVWVQLSLSTNEAENELISLHYVVTWFNKTATRLGEATMFTFYPKKQHDKSKWEGILQKISSRTSIKLDSVLKNGSQYQHAALSATLSEVSQTQTVYLMALTSPDVPLVCPVVSNVKSPTPFPAPLDPVDPSNLQGIAFNLHNNVWNTNYPLWYPFVDSDRNFKARFTAKFVKTT